MRFTYLTSSVFRSFHQRNLPFLGLNLSARLSDSLIEITPTFRTTHRLNSTTQDGDSSTTDLEAMSEDENKLYRKLQQRFLNGKIAVQDVSGGCGQFFAIQVIHPDFTGLSTLKQHRLINQTLSNEIKSIHGLQVHSQLFFLSFFLFIICSHPSFNTFRISDFWIRCFHDYRSKPAPHDIMFICFVI
ncbi:bola protein [Melampsora americana]|nr:bola protein [Melampsora americana]